MVPDLEAIQISRELGILCHRVLPKCQNVMLDASLLQMVQRFQSTDRTENGNKFEVRGPGRKVKFSRMSRKVRGYENI